MAMKKKKKATTATSSRRKVRILSIDGGGIRGIIPATILQKLEDKLIQHTGNNNTRLADHFDLVAGTSTGGILACLYLCPDSQNKRRPKFTAQEAMNLYLDRGDEIFDISLWQRATSGLGILDEKYSADALEETLADYFKETLLSELLKPCLITSYDIKRRQAHFFNQQDAKNKGHDFRVRDLARATSAAPTYFEVSRIKSQTNLTYPLIDGGVFANNPTMCAYAEAREQFKQPGNEGASAKDMTILSIGTGTIEKSYAYNEAKNWGKAEWIVPLIDILMSGVAETVDYQLKKIFDSIGKADHYVRISPKLQEGNPELDDATQDNMQGLQQDGIEAAQKQDADLERIAKIITDPSGPWFSPKSP